MCGNIDVDNAKDMEIKFPSESVNEVDIVDISDDTVLDVTVASGDETKYNKMEIIEPSDDSDENGDASMLDNILGEFSSSLLKYNVRGSHCHGVVTRVLYYMFSGLLVQL